MLALIDWIIIAAYIVMALAIGLFYTRRASRSKEDFFLSGRSLPWWLVGTSMAATNFAADTPLAVTGMVARQGVAGVWFLWSSAITATLATFFFARLWRRARVVTDAEIIELRYSGPPARALRLFKGFYFGVIINCFVMAWVMVAMSKIMAATLGWDKLTTLAVFSLITVAYTMLSGFWGVVVTDFVQYFLAALSSVMLAVLSVRHVGGVSMLKERLDAIYGSAEQILSFVPPLSQAELSLKGVGSVSLSTFMTYLLVQWWAQKYADGGGKIIQRMSSARDEKQAVLGTMWFSITNYSLQVWPWIVTAAVTMVVYPGLSDPEAGYPRIMMEILPHGLLGLMVVSLVGAFMSTIDTHLNLGASYMVNDIYERFFRPGASQAHLVAVSRLAMVLLMGISCVVAWQINSIGDAWKFIIAFSSGAGLTFIVRWLWWRPNAWTEFSGMIASGAVATLLKLFRPELDHGQVLLIVVPASTLCWLVATFTTTPVERDVLVAFYGRVQPGTPWWGDIPDQCELTGHAGGFGSIVVNFLVGVLCLYLLCFGVGSLAFAHWLRGVAMMAAGGVLLVLLIRRTGG